MTKATVQIPKDTSKKHKIVIPREIWEIEGLQEGDYIEIDIRKLGKILCEFAGCRNPGKLFKNVYGFKDTVACDLHVNLYERETGKKLEEVIE